MPIRCKRRTVLTRLFIICSLSACLLLYLRVPADDSPSFSEENDNNTSKYIFNLIRWHIMMLNGPTFGLGKDTILCDVPVKLRPIADALCQKYFKKPCTQLPCELIYSSPKTLTNLTCAEGGRVWTASEPQPMLPCKRGYSLDLFLLTNKPVSYPSISTHALVSFDDQLYREVLGKQFRTPDSIWGLTFNFESILNYPWAADPKQLEMFNVTSGYNRQLYDFVPAPWLFNYVDRLKSNANRLPLGTVMNHKKFIQSSRDANNYWPNVLLMNSSAEKKNGNSSFVTAPILWMNSNCQTRSNRTEYLSELIKYIDVDNYGTCGGNIRRLPEHIVRIQNSLNRNLKNRGSYNWEAGKLNLSSGYLFTVAIENSISHDYITEKLWHPLVAGSVPIYLGAPNVQDWLPCETDCIIDLRQFKSPQDAAQHIRKVATNRTLYESYHQWRKHPVQNKFQRMLNYFQKMSGYTVNCILCDMSHRVSRGEDINAFKSQLKATIGSF